MAPPRLNETCPGCNREIADPGVACEVDVSIGMYYCVKKQQYINNPPTTEENDVRDNP